MLDIMFDLPQYSGKTIIITKETIEEKTAPKVA
jgi:ATP-dependent protease Clp ATPase subunit